MKSYIIKLLLFISLFIFFYPEQYTFLPFPTIRFVQIIGIVFTILYIHKKKTIKVYYLKIIKYGLIIFIIGLISSKILNNGGDLDIAKRGIIMISHIFVSLWIVYLLRKSTKENLLSTIINWIIVITIIQSIISIIFFIFPTIAETYRTYVVTDEAKMNALESVSVFRLVGIGDVRYATAAVQYGLVMWGIIALKHQKYGFWYKHHNVYLLIITLFALTGIMSGRVFFVILLLSIPYLFILNNNNIYKTIQESFQLFIPITIIGLIAFTFIFIENEELINWVFELFINYGVSGNFESESTNQLKDMYIYPNNFNTWILGDGKSINENGSFYMNTDVGYIRSLFYWGIIGTIIYYFIQYKCYNIISKMRISKAINIYILFIVIWLYVYSLKDFYSIERFLVLFIVVQSFELNKIKKYEI